MRVALPKTYHQPVRGGTGCSSARRVAVMRPLRSSSQARRRRSTGAQAIGMGPVRISTWPSRTRTGYLGSGFGGGPALTVPSR